MKKILFAGLICFVLALVSQTVFCQPAKFKWEKYSYPAHKFSIQSPFPFEKHSDQNGQFVIGTGKEFKNGMVGVTSTELKGKYSNVTLREIPGRMAKVWGSIKGNLVTGFVSKSTTCSGYPALLTTMNVKVDDNGSRKIIFLDVKSGSTWWEALVLYDVEGNGNSSVIANRVLGSFEILK